MTTAMSFVSVCRSELVKGGKNHFLFELFQKNRAIRAFCDCFELDADCLRKYSSGQASSKDILAPANIPE